MQCCGFWVYKDLRIGLFQNLDGQYLQEVQWKQSFLNEYFCTFPTWVQIWVWQAMLSPGTGHQVTVCAEGLPLCKCSLGPSKQKQPKKKKKKSLSAIFVHRNTELDPKNTDTVRGTSRSQLLIIYGNGGGGHREGSQRWKTSDKATPFHCHSFQPPFIRAVNKEQKKMDFLLPSKRIKQ